ncbi:MAG: PAS domain-containing protein, partial [Alphaproteobacteria bacterium]|nr:PAS domain-containing protein [Alphaproteobacteria bacterium]
MRSWHKKSGGPAPPQKPFASIAGEMADRVRAFPWQTTPLGSIEHWPQSLKTAVGIVLLSPVPIVMLWGEDGIMIYNDAYAVFAGGRHPKLLGSKVREGWPEVADFNDNVMKVGLAGGTLAYRDQELTLNRTGEPEQVWLNLDYSPIPDESGRPAGVMAVVVETTERVRADAALRRSEERLRLATENAEVGLWDIDEDQNITFVYPRGAFSMPQDRKTQFAEFAAHVHPEDMAALAHAYAAARDPQQRRSFEVEYRTLAMDGAPPRWVSVKGRGIFDAAGNCIRMSGTAIEITKRKEAELALRHREEQLRLATEHGEIG